MFLTEFDFERKKYGVSLIFIKACHCCYWGKMLNMHSLLHKAGAQTGLSNVPGQNTVSEENGSNLVLTTYDCCFVLKWMSLKASGFEIN